MLASKEALFMRFQSFFKNVLLNARVNKSLKKKYNQKYC